MKATIKSRMSSTFGLIGPRTADVAILGHREKSLSNFNGKYVVATLVPSFLVVVFYYCRHRGHSLQFGSV